MLHQVLDFIRSVPHRLKNPKIRYSVIAFGATTLCICSLILMWPHLFDSHKITVILDSEKLPLENSPVVSDDVLMLPAREILEALDCSIAWDAETDEVTANHQGREIRLKEGSDTSVVNRRTHQLSHPITETNDTTFIPAEFLEPALGAIVNWYADDNTVIIVSPAPRETLQDTTVPDTFRLSGKPQKYNGVTVIDGIGMELLHVSNEQAVQYADVVNAIAASLPETVNCYNLIVPTMAEFYAPKELYPDYTEFIRTIYSNLELNVTPVNLIDPLLAHADEPIYFTTDHHWTQRGAYYAYDAYLKHAGGEIEPLDTFENLAMENYRGSLVGFTRGTAGAELLGSDTLERFMPKTDVTGTAYLDAQMTQPFRSLNLVNSELSTYSCFIEGDVPLAVFKTGAGTGRKIAIIKESFGNAFATWAVNNYDEVYVIDLREFNGDSPNGNMSIADFYEMTHFDDLVIINYPVSVASVKHRQALYGFATKN